MKNKKSFVLYADLIHTVSKLPNDKAGELFKHLLEYVNDLEPETDDLIVNISFEPIKQQLKRDLKKWDEIRGKRSEAGKKSAESKKLQKQQVLTSVESVEQTSTKSTVSVNDNVNVSVNVNDNVIKKERKFNFRKSLLEYGFDSDLVDDWMKVRKTKKATNTKTSFNSFIKQVEKSGMHPDEILTKCIESDWKGFNFEWIKPKEKSFGQKEKPDRVLMALEQMERMKLNRGIK